MKKRIQQLLKKSDFIYPICIFIFTLSIYIHNLSPSVFGGDSGDFLSAILTNGIPHPSGYPLHTMLGILFLKLPFSATPAWKVGIISSIFSSTTVVVMYLTVNELVKNKYLAVLTSLIVAFLYPFWIYAEVVEIFSLHFLFILIIIFLTIKYFENQKTKYLYYLSFFSGLSLTNNLSILLLLLPTVLFVLITNTGVVKNLKIILATMVIFLLGLTPYIYIPIAASFSPEINWDRAVTLKNLVDLISRKDYGWGNLTKDPFFPKNALGAYALYWLEYLSPLLPIISFPGILYLMGKKNYKLLVYLFSCFLLLGPFYIIYARLPTLSLANIATLERFYTSSALALAIFTPFGILFFLDFIQKYLQKPKIANILTKIALGVYTVVPISLFITNFSKTNLNNVYIGDNLAKDILTPLSKDSFMFVTNDEFAFNSLYIQHAENFRKDVTIPGRNTGFDHFLTTSGVTIDEDPATYSIRRRNAIDHRELYQGIVNLLDNNIDVYSTEKLEIVENESGKIITIPYGLLYKLVNTNSPRPTKEEYLAETEQIWAEFHVNEILNNKDVILNSFTLSNIRRYYALPYQNIAYFLKYYYKDNKLYERYMQKAKETDPLHSTLINQEL